MGVFGIMVILFFCALVAVIALYMLNSFLDFLPVPSGNPNLYNPLVALYLFFQAMFDNSFLFIYIIVIFIDILISYLKPNFAIAISNIVLLLLLAYFSLFIQIGVATFQAIDFSTLLPQVYLFFGNGYYLILTFFGLILSIIFNFKSPKANQ